MNKNIGLSVFFPAYNEEKNIGSTLKQAIEVLDKIGLKNYEVIVVNDASEDKTKDVVENMIKSNRNLKLIDHEKNGGYGAALKTGFKAAKYLWVAFADSDGQFDFSEIVLFLDKTNDADLILGYRLNRADSFARSIFTFGWSLIAKILLGLKARDYSCGFKLIRKEVFDAVLPLEGEEKVTQIEMLVKAARFGYRFAEVGVHHYPRKYGSSTGANINVVIKSVLDLLKLWWRLR